MSQYEQEELLSHLEEYLVFVVQVGQVTKEVKEFRFSKGKICPHCDGEEVLKSGKYNRKQRYICRACNKSFTYFTNIV